MTDASTPLARYALKLRRQRLVYFSIVSVIVIAVGVVVAVAWSRGETANTSLHTVAKAPADLRLATPVDAPKQSWTTDDRAAIGAPQYRGSVVLFGKHTVRGVDARTGHTTWSYSRSNRTVCTAAQLGGTTVAVYELAGNCDEVTALDSGTGKRRWTRTLDMDGMPLDGHATFRTSIQGIGNTLLIASSSVIYALDPGSGYNRWTYTRFGCSITGVALGSNGTLIGQNCVKPRCGKVKLCGSGPQLLLRTASTDRNDKDETNPDLITWNRIGNDEIPVSADGLISALDPRTGELDQLDGKNGASRARIPIGAHGTSPSVVANEASGIEIVWAAGVTYAVQSGVATPIWTARTPGPPTLMSTTGEDAPSLDTARITVPSTSGVRLLDGTSGQTGRSFALPPPAAGSLVYSLGTGFLVSGPAGTVAYA